MTMTERDPLDDFFDAARARPPAPDPALMARVLADAEAQAAAREAPVPVRSGGFAGILRGLGGWPALAGFATATAAGVWIGVALPDVTQPFLGGAAYDVNDLLPGYGTDLLVGG
ncbi:MAG: hypothetical protein AAGA71_00115 [Pseudomonadota bacterium]